MAASVLLYAVIRLPRDELKRFILLYVIGVVLAVVLTKIAGSIYDNPRPFVDGDYQPLIPHSPTNGFPSNHTVAVFLIALMLWRYSKRLMTGLLIAALFVGLARVLSSVHHIEDIIGGILIAVLATLLAYRVVNTMLHNKAIEADN